MNRIINLKKNGQKTKGYLSFFEEERDIPFQIKRIYYIYDTPNGVNRGMHAHKNLNQVLWCPYGNIEVELDSGSVKKNFILDFPQKLLLVGPGIWHDMIWKKEGSVLCVAASDYYDEGDYIRDYNEFLRHIREGYWKDEDQL